MKYFIHISSSWEQIRLHAENQHSMLPGSALKVGGRVRVGWWDGMVGSWLSWAGTMIAKCMAEKITKTD